MSSDPPAETVWTTLLIRLQRGDNLARTEIDTIYRGTIEGRLRNLEVQPEDIRDLAGDVIVRVFEKAKTFARDGRDHSFRRWIFVVTRNMAMDYFRSRLPRADLDNSALQQLKDGAGTESQQLEELRNEARRMVNLIRHEFEPKTIRCFEAYFFEGEPTSKTAAELGMAEGAVRDARSRVLKRLRDLFFDLYGETDWPFRVG